MDKQSPLRHVVVTENGLFAFLDNAYIRRCPLCDEALERPAGAAVLPAISRGLPLSATCDGLLMASNEFARWYAGAGLDGMEFVPAGGQGGAFWAVCVSAKAAFDTARRGTTFVNRCPLCGRHELVTGATPVVLAPGAHVPPNAFAVTDLEFGVYDAKRPLLLCGDSAARALQELAPEGISLERIEA